MDKAGIQKAAIAIRRMTAGDLARVHQLDQMCFSAPWPLRTFEYELHQNQASRQWVALEAQPGEADGRIVGAIVTWLVGDEVHIATLSVDPERRRQKIGSQLVCAALRNAVASGARAATLEVRAGNAAAQRLYARFGFQVVGRRPGYYLDNGEDALLLTLHDLDDDHLNIIGCA